nr:MAG TPA: hypothetical protein [Caudoviricetes sp.]
MSDFGIMWIAVSVTAIAGMIITGKPECLCVLILPFILTFL